VVMALVLVAVGLALRLRDRGAAQGLAP